jgi:hypothetical protein
MILGKEGVLAEASLPSAAHLLYSQERRNLVLCTMSRKQLLHEISSRIHGSFTGTPVRGLGIRALKTAGNFLILSGTSKLCFTGVILLLKFIKMQFISLLISLTNCVESWPPAARMSISSYADFLHRIVLADFLL